jgi:hypothetical protein
MAYMIQKYCENVELAVYEKNAEIGGTWYENRYPGNPVACWYIAGADIRQDVLATCQHMRTHSTLHLIQNGHDFSHVRLIF